MKVYFNLIGLLLSIAGTIIIIKGVLNTSAASIRHFWNDVQKSWQKKKPNILRRFTCYLAKIFGSDNLLDTEDYTVEVFEKYFWGFILLFFGFLFQFISILIQLDLFFDISSK